MYRPLRSARSTVVERHAMYGGFWKITISAHHDKDLPLGMSDMSFRDRILSNTVPFGGMGHVIVIFFGEWNNNIPCFEPASLMSMRSVAWSQASHLHGGKVHLRTGLKLRIC
jgi:hypothetical protein